MTIVAFYSKGTSIEVQNTWSERLKFYHPSLKLVPLLSEEAKFATIALLWKAPLNYLNKMTRIKGLISLGQGVDHILNGNLIPENISNLGVKVNYNIDEVIEWADAVNILRIQRERMGIGLVPSNREYRRLFGVTSERINRRKKELVIMHPGPINRGVEIDSQVADSDQAIILDQVLNGVASRMSILYLLLGHKEENTNEG